MCADLALQRTESLLLVHLDLHALLVVTEKTVEGLRQRIVLGEAEEIFVSIYGLELILFRLRATSSTVATVFATNLLLHRTAGTLLALAHLGSSSRGWLMVVYVDF